MIEEGSLAPLHYDIRALRPSLLDGDGRNKVCDSVRQLLDDVKEYVGGDPGRDAGGQLGRNLEALRKLLPELEEREIVS